MIIAIIGVGTMGVNIAQPVALGEYEVILHDTDAARLRAALGTISRGFDQGVRLQKIEPVAARRARRMFALTTEIEKCAAADIVIEAVYDDMDLKQSILQQLDDLVSENAILATTTNTLSIGQLAAATRQPERVLGLHFCNPANVMRLVEVVRAPRTRPDVLDRAIAFVRQIGKSPVVLQDMPGLIVNRVGQFYFGEALRLLDDNNLDIATIDRLMEAAGFPMGPFRLMDFVGVDTVYSVSRAMYEATFHAVRYRPHPRQHRMVGAGLVGHNGGGFYQHAPGTDQADESE